MISGGIAFSDVSLRRSIMTSFDSLVAEDDLVTKANDVGAAISNKAVTTFGDMIIVPFYSIGSQNWSSGYLCQQSKYFGNNPRLEPCFIES